MILPAQMRKSELADTIRELSMHRERDSAIREDLDVCIGEWSARDFGALPIATAPPVETPLRTKRKRHRHHSRSTTCSRCQPMTDQPLENP